ncbi:MAG: ribose 5-phosphate isomerase B [Candidatus Kryptoniota bacterium]
MIALASDHAGFEYKERIKKILDELHMEYRDYGAFDSQSSDYPDYVYPAALAISRGECDRGIMVCGSGIGVDMVANKVKNVRSALCTSVEMAELSRRHNDANVLSIGERLTNWEVVKEMVVVWLNTNFEGGRHQRRIEKMHSLTGC